MTIDADAAQPPAPAPPQQPHQGPAQAQQKGLAVAALVVGISAFLLGLLPIVGIIVGLVGVGLGIFALVKEQPKGFAVTGLVLAACGFLASCGTTAGISSISSDTAEETSLQTTIAPAEEAEPAPPPSATPEPEPAPAPQPAEPELTIGQRNAVQSAEQYLNYSGFSRTGLIGQLEFEGFSTEDATFAVDTVGADWNAEAAESAQDYLDYTSFSRQGLLDQLIFEGFTPEEAEFGVAAVGY